MPGGGNAAPPGWLEPTRSTLHARREDFTASTTIHWLLPYPASQRLQRQPANNEPEYGKNSHGVK